MGWRGNRAVPVRRTSLPARPNPALGGRVTCSRVQVLKTRVTLACWAVACCSASPLLFLEHESGIMPILSRGLHMPRALQNPHALEM